MHDYFCRIAVRTADVTE